MNDQIIILRSKVLGRAVPVRVLVPHGSNMKCLFLLHGYGGDENQWAINSIIAQLAAQHHLVAVMPSCGDGYYEDTQENIPAFLGEELVSYVQENLPVSEARNDRLLAGVSMGGFGSLLIGAKYPTTFGKIASFSGAFIIPDVVIGNQGVLGPAEPDYFRKVFGDFETLEGSSRDPIAEALRANQQHLLPPVYFVCGTEDVLYSGNWKAFQSLSGQGAPTIWHSQPGRHEWSFWNSVLPQVINWLST